MSVISAVCYLDDDNKVVGIKYEAEKFKVNEGEVTANTIAYPYTRVFPIEFLVVDGDPLAVRVLTSAEVEFLAAVAEGEACRDECIEKPIIVHDGLWKMESKDRANIQDGIDEADLVGLPDDYEQDWIMADGSIFKATPLKLKQVLSAYRQRKQEIFNQYIVWLSGGAVGDFDCTAPNTYTF